MTARDRARRRRGYTVLELTIVGGMMAMLAMFFSAAWAAFGRPASDAIARARVAQEAGHAADALARDLGGSLAAHDARTGQLLQYRLVGRLQPDDELRLCFDGGDEPDGIPNWLAPDHVIIYYREDSRLVRWDWTAGIKTTIARHLYDLDVSEPAAGRVRIGLTFRLDHREKIPGVGYAAFARTYTFEALDPWEAD